VLLDKPVLALTAGSLSMLCVIFKPR